MHRVPLRRTYISRLTHIQCYKIYGSVKKKRYSCILMRGEVFLAWLKAQGGEGGWRTLVGDNMGGGTVQPRPIRFQHVAVWISTGLSLSVSHTHTHTHTHKSCPCTGVERPLGRQKLEAPRIFRQLTHEGGSLVSPTHWLSLIPRY